MDLLKEPTYKSTNNLDMVKGKWFDWEKSSIYRESTEPPYMFLMTFERSRKEPSMVTCLYRPDEEVVYIGGVAYKALDGETAELICLLAVMGEGGAIMPLYYGDDKESYSELLPTISKILMGKKKIPKIKCSTAMCRYGSFMSSSHPCYKECKHPQ